MAEEQKDSCRSLKLNTGRYEELMLDDFVRGISPTHHSTPKLARTNLSQKRPHSSCQEEDQPKKLAVFQLLPEKGICIPLTSWKKEEPLKPPQNM
jgi:hypothetical protein